MKPILDFENRQSLDKLLHAYLDKQSVPDSDMEVYLVVLATVKAPAEIWPRVPKNLQSNLRKLVELAVKAGPNSPVIAGGAWEEYWSHDAVVRWNEFFQQLDKAAPNT
jgi:hypothetical protein